LKKLIIACNIVILFIVLIKIAAVTSLLTVNKAAADSPVMGGFEPPVKDVCEDSLSEERKLLSSLLEKQKALDDRENFLQSEERRLNLLRDEILSKIDSLQELEKRLTGLLEMVEERNNSKYKSIAKVYESTPPARAGSMLEKLDTRTAAAIIMNMRSKSAGAILGHVNPARSVEITREITRSGARSQKSEVRSEKVRR
jgi:flagellar motility protein MotE (MotC chaperone)